MHLYICVHFYAMNKAPATTLLQFVASTWCPLNRWGSRLPASRGSAGACVAASSTILSRASSSPVVLSTVAVLMARLIGCCRPAVRNCVLVMPDPGLSGRLQVEEDDDGRGLFHQCRSKNEGLRVQRAVLTAAAQGLRHESPAVVRHRARAGDRASVAFSGRAAAARHSRGSLRLSRAWLDRLQVGR